MSKLTGWMVIKTIGCGGPYTGDNIQGDKTVYENQDAAEFIWAEKRANLGEWEEVKCDEVKYEMLNATKCDVGGRVCVLDRTTKVQLVRSRATAKLSKEERAALHLPSDETLEAVASLEKAFANLQTNMDGIVTVAAESVNQAKSVFKSILGK